MAMEETDLTDKAHNTKLMNSLENVINEYAEFLEMLDDKGFDFSHGAGGQISNIYKRKKTK